MDAFRYRFNEAIAMSGVFTCFVFLLSIPCQDEPATPTVPLRPIVTTEPVAGDSDDPAVWIDRVDPSHSVILGTDKGGALHAFTLEGKALADRTVRGLARPNNVDVEYGLSLAGRSVDIAVVTERDAGRIRIFEAPSLRPLDDGGIAVFEGEDDRRPMGVGLYRRENDGAIFAILTRKLGASGALLHQYRLEDRGDGTVRAVKVRAFGAWSGPKDPQRPNDPEEGNECESVVVDDKSGFVYYSEEKVGVHKYLADPDAKDAHRELALFATSDFEADREGLSIFTTDDHSGWILVSDQGARRFQVFPREGTAGDAHRHERLGVIDVSALESDGSEIVSTPLGPRFPKGLFVAMSDNRTFQLYDWRELESRLDPTTRR